MSSKLELEWKSPIPNPENNPDGESIAFYTGFYNFQGTNRKNKAQENREDSPDKSRSALIERVYPYIHSLPKESFVLDLGAGRQIFEKEYEEKYGKPACNIITVDSANIPKTRLLTKGYPHIQASGRSLPFANEVFDATISNMAFDFMLPEGLAELYRVSKQGAFVFLTLHHQSLLNYDIDNKLRKLTRNINHKAQGQGHINERTKLQLGVYLYHVYLRDNKMLFETKDQIREFFNAGGFDTKRIDVKSDPADKWWEVDLVKQSVIV
jgi:ubiquinone/menaquinone biosynthesis C-methylase UbiE